LQRGEHQKTKLDQQKLTSQLSFSLRFPLLEDVQAQPEVEGKGKGKGKGKGERRPRGLGRSAFGLRFEPWAA
jgi:hypothetical protein